MNTEAKDFIVQVVDRTAFAEKAPQGHWLVWGKNQTVAWGWGTSEEVAWVRAAILYFQEMLEVQRRG